MHKQEIIKRMIEKVKKKGIKNNEKHNVPNEEWSNTDFLAYIVLLDVHKDEMLSKDVKVEGNYY